jgi:hypothetical protein
VLVLVAGPAAGVWAGGAEAATLAASSRASATASDQDDGGWWRVQQIKKGEKVIIGVNGREPLKYTLLAADGSGLVVVKRTHKDLDDDIIDAFVKIGAEWPGVLAGRPTAQAGFKIRDGAVYRKDKKLMDVAAVVERIDRAAVTEVRGAHTKSAGDPNHSAATSQGLLGAGIGAAIGLGAYALPVAIMGCDVSDCIHFTAQGALLAAGIGAAIVGLRGVANGYQHDTFYVAPNNPARTLDDVAWERLRLSLPPSLQGAGATRKSETNIRPSPTPSAAAKGSPWSVTF